MYGRKTKSKIRFLSAAASALLICGLTAAPSAPKTAVRDASGDRYKHEMDKMIDPNDIQKMNNNFYSGQYASTGASNLTKSTSSTATIGLGLNDPLEKKLFIGLLYKTSLGFTNSATSSSYSNSQTAVKANSRLSTHDAWISVLLKDLGIAVIFGHKTSGTGKEGYYKSEKASDYDLNFTHTGDQTMNKLTNIMTTNYHVGVDNQRTHDNSLTLAKKMEKFLLFVPLSYKVVNDKQTAQEEFLMNGKVMNRRIYKQDETKTEFGIGAGIDGFKMPGELSMYGLKAQVGFDFVPKTYHRIAAAYPGLNYNGRKLYKKNKASLKVELGQGRKFDKFEFKSKPVKLEYYYQRTVADLGWEGSLTGAKRMIFTNYGTEQIDDNKIQYKPEIGAEFKPRKITTFRAGVKYSGTWQDIATKTYYEPKADGSGGQVRKMIRSTGFTGSQTSIAFGMGFNFTPNLSIDSVASSAITGIGIAKDLYETGKFSALLTYRWDGPAMKIIK